jgi:hypothetical protein
MKLFYDPNGIDVSCSDGDVMNVAKLLEYQNVATSNWIVVEAAKVLVIRGEIEPFILIAKDKEYECGSKGFIPDEPPSIIDQLFQGLLIEQQRKKNERNESGNN